VIHAFVPSDYKRDRHAVFVGNARSIRIVGTTATLRRTPIPPRLRPAELEGRPRPADLAGRPRPAEVVFRPRVTEVEGIRVHGRFGPFLVIRDSSLSGFTVGVRVVPMSTPGEVTWLVCDTMAEGAGQAVEAPATVAQERNHPALGRRLAGPPAIVDLVPSVATAAAGAKHRVTATVRDVARLPVESAIVRFSVSGANAAAETGATTNADGQASFEYTGANAGTDTIRAYADVNRNGALDIGEPFATALQTYVAQQPATIEFLQPSLAATVGQEVVLTVRVRDVTGNPVAGTDVRFSRTGANPAEPGAPVQTTAQGEAVLRYQGTNDGTDVVTAAMVSGGQARTANATVTQLRPVPTKLLVAPGQGHGFRGEPITFTATVLDAAGTAVRGVQVRFTVAGANFTGGELTSNAEGQVAFTYTGTNAGTDEVTAFADLNDNDRQDVGEPFAKAQATFFTREIGRVIVPDVNGMDLESARSTLAEVGLSVGNVATIASFPRFGTPVVIDQQPLAGSRVTPGSLVHLTMGRSGGIVVLEEGRIVTREGFDALRSRIEERPGGPDPFGGPAGPIR
jgi:uncharacterized protein (DUF2141 family)